MNTETLVCTNCGQKWQREIKRGRKPTVCPDCKNGTAGNKAVVPQPDPEPSDFVFKSVTPELVRAARVSDVEVEWVGDPVGVSMNAVHYDKAIVDGVTFSTGDTVRVHGERGTYRVRRFTEAQDDQYPFMEMVGLSGNYQGKYRAVGAERISRG